MKMHIAMRHKRRTIENLKSKIANTPKDPRTAEMLETIQKLDSEIFESNEEIKLLSKTAKKQFATIKKKNDNPQIEERLEILKKEISEAKKMAREKEKQAKDISFNSKLQV